MKETNGGREDSIVSENDPETKRTGIRKLALEIWFGSQLSP
jgi:hypothetical protein